MIILNPCHHRVQQDDVLLVARHPDDSTKNILDLMVHLDTVLMRLRCRS